MLYKSQYRFLFYPVALVIVPGVLDEVESFSNCLHCSTVAGMIRQVFLEQPQLNSLSFYSV